MSFMFLAHIPKQSQCQGSLIQRLNMIMMIDHNINYEYRQPFHEFFGPPNLSQCEAGLRIWGFLVIYGTMLHACAWNMKTSTSISHAFLNITFGSHLRDVYFRQKTDDFILENFLQKYYININRLGSVACITYYVCLAVLVLEQ